MTHDELDFEDRLINKLTKSGWTYNKKGQTKK